MSLLLEALKKAEKAKEEAQRRARGETPPVATAEIRPEPSLGFEPQAAEAKPVMTRPELPDIRQPLEILSDEIAPKPVAEPAEAPAAADTRDADRATARKVFEAKFREPNPRLPFYLTLGVLGVLAVGVVIYFWYQLRPPAPLVNPNPSANEVARPAGEAKPIAAPIAAAPTAIPGLPQASPPTATTPPPAAKPAPAPIATVEAAAPPPAPLVRRPSVEPRPAQRRAESAPSPRQAPQIHPKVQSGYNAFLAGELATARADYQAALADEPANRDALLGLAAIDVRLARFESAEATYLRLLQTDPNDAYAQAGLLALRAARLDPLATESRVKTLLAADPGANVLHFTLGNQLAQQGRWAEAQQEYFRAFAADPENADFAFNLAVSLDHLRQAKAALEYYRRAVSLAEKRAATFDVAAARARIAQLGN